MQAGAREDGVGDIRLGLGLWLPQAARALGQRLSQTGSVQHGAPQAMGLEPV